MKTKFLMVSIAAIICMACSKENEMENGNIKIRLRSGVEVQTRTFTPVQSTQIGNGEQVSVWINDAGVVGKALYLANPLKADGANGLEIDGGDDMYFPQTGNAINIYAIHGKFTTPFTKETSFPDVAVEYSVENNQAPGVGNEMTNYAKSDLLYAVKNGVSRAGASGNVKTEELTFYHMLSKLELAIMIGTGAPELDITGAVTLNGITLNGYFTPAINASMDNREARALMLGNASTQAIGNITLGQTVCSDFTTDNVIYNEVVIVPQELSGKALTFQLKNGGILKYTFPAVTFESGKKYRYHITLDLTGLKISSSIADWDAVGTPVIGTATMD